MPSSISENRSDRKAYIITGPTSGIGRRTAFELAKHGTVVLVGRDRRKLDEVQKTIEQKRQHAVSVVCDLSDIASVRHAAAEIIALHLPIAGLLNNAGIMQMRATKNALGWDMTFATNHLGPVRADRGARAASPRRCERRLHRLRRGRSRAQARRGRRLPRWPLYLRGGERARRVETRRLQTSRAQMPTPLPSNAILAAAMAFARETPRLHFNAIEPGLNPTTGLGGDLGAFVRFLQTYIIPLLVPLLMPFIKILSTPKRAARVITKILIDASGQTGIYYDEGGHPMLGSALVRDPKFQDRVVAETRALLSTISQ